MYIKCCLKCYQPIHRYPLSHNIGPDSKVHGADMRPIWGLQVLGGPHVGPMNFAIWGVFTNCYLSTIVPIQYRFKRVECDTMSYLNILRWRHQMETFSSLQALCAGNSPATGEFPSPRPVTRSFDVFYDVRLNKRLGKQSTRRWLETPSRSICCHCNAMKQGLTMEILRRKQ